MKPEELTEYLFSFANDRPETCDRFTHAAVNTDRDISRIAVTCFPSIDVIRKSIFWGADILIVHEPLYYQHMDENPDLYPVQRQKKQLLDDADLPVVRWHDHPHDASPDVIAHAMTRLLGTGIYKDVPRNNGRPAHRMILAEPRSASDIAAAITGKLCGDPAANVRCVSLIPGASGSESILEEFNDENVDMVLCGEVSEWCVAEYARDAAALGISKALLIGGHCLTEEYGMEDLKDMLLSRWPEADVRFFSAGTPYRLFA